MMTPEKPAIEKFKSITRVCIEQGHTLPQLALILIEEMEKQTPLAERIYAGVCKSSWVEVSAYPWPTKKLEGDEDDIAIGKF